MSIETLDERWNQFLVKARERFVELLAQAVDDCEALLDVDPGYARSVVTAWTAMSLRARGVRAKLDELWATQVCERYERESERTRARAADARRQALADWMDIELRRAETGVFADVVRRLLGAVEADLAKHACADCHEPLRPKLCLRPIEQHCRACGRLAIIEPGEAAELAIELGPHLWRESCWELWVGKHQAELLVRRSQEVTLAQLKAWEQAEIEYMHAWLRERAKLLPIPEEQTDAELRRQLEQFYASLERLSVWTRAGSPRALDVGLMVDSSTPS
jgi:hypothetical protein